MKTIFLSILFCFTGFIVAAQRKTIVGKVLLDMNPVTGVEIINLNTKTVDVTNQNGEFSILVNPKDTLKLYAKDFLIQTYIIDKKDFLLPNLLIYLNKKAIELEAVEVKKGPSFKLDMSYESLAKVKIDNRQGALQPIGVPTHSIPNGMDFTEIFRKLFSIFKSKKDKESKVEKVEFKNYVRDNFSNDFFTQTLKLKPSEVEFFIDFCNDDPQSKTIADKNGILDVMEFLLKKKEEFKR